MSKKKTDIDPKLWLTISKGKKKAKKNPDAPKKESSGDADFDKTIRELLKKNQ